MRNLLRLIIKHYFVLLFIFLEGMSFLLLFQFNPYQKSLFVNFSRNINSAVYRKIGDWSNYFALREQNEQLFRENVRLQNELSVKDNLRYIIFHDTLSPDTLDHGKTGQFYFVPARVINNSVQRQYNYITIDAGSKQGIMKDMAVISDGSVVGTITGVSDNFSTVIPILNRNFRVGASLARNNYFGILEWDGMDAETAKLQEIPLHVEAKKGDAIVTSGYSAIFPPGLRVGTIESISVEEGNFYDINVHLAVNFRTLKYVAVVKNTLREEQKDLEKTIGYD